MLRTVLAYCSWAARGVISAVLPAPERDQIAAGYQISPPRWSFALGMIGGAVGLMLYMGGALGFMGLLGGEQALALLDSPMPGFGRLAGIMTWLTWHLQPEAWLYMYLALMGLVRVLAFAITGQAVAEAVILPPLRGIQWLRGRAARQARLVRLGPTRSDRVLAGKGGDLVVLSCREKEDWDEVATIKIAGRFYCLIDVADRPDGRWTAIAYRLREIGSTDLIRKLVKTDLRPPTGYTSATKTPPAGFGTSRLVRRCFPPRCTTRYRMVSSSAPPNSAAMRCVSRGRPRMAAAKPSPWPPLARLTSPGEWCGK